MHKKVRYNKNPLGPGVPFAKGIVLRTVVKKPKKPNSANRKVPSRKQVLSVPNVQHTNFTHRCDVFLYIHRKVLIQNSTEFQDCPLLSTFQPKKNFCAENSLLVLRLLNEWMSNGHFLDCNLLFQMKDSDVLQP